MVIQLNERGEPIDGACVEWTSRVGIWVRPFIPIHYGDFRHVPSKLKDDVWKHLKEKDSSEITLSRTEMHIIAHTQKYGSLLDGLSRKIVQTDEGVHATLEKAIQIGVEKALQVLFLGPCISRKVTCSPRTRECPKNTC